MERDTHYFVVGLFIIATLIAGAMFAGLFYDKPQLSSMPYELHFDTPVLGLEPGSEVRYMGIKKGEVSRVFLLPDDPSRVGVVIAVEQDTPVNTATIASLQQQGLTGVPFVSLAQSGNIASPTPLVALEGNEAPLIPTKPPSMEELLASLPELEKVLTQLLRSASDVLNVENRQNFAGLLTNLNKVSSDLPALSASLEQTNTQLQGLIKHVDVVITQSEKDLATNMQGLQETLDSLHKTSRQLDKLFQDVDRLVVTNESRINELLGEGGENLKQLLGESRKTAAAIRQLSDKLGQNPSQIIYQPAPQGTELPR